MQHKCRLIILSHHKTTSDDVSSGSVQLQRGEHYFLSRILQTSELQGCQQHKLVLLQPWVKIHFYFEHVTTPIMCFGAALSDDSLLCLGVWRWSIHCVSQPQECMTYMITGRGKKNNNRKELHYYCYSPPLFGRGGVHVNRRTREMFV